MHLDSKLSMSRRAFVGGSSGTYNVRASELAREKHIKIIRCNVFFLDESQQIFEMQVCLNVQSSSFLQVT